MQARHQEQRVAIARVLANQPSLLLADEPTDNLNLRTPRPGSDRKATKQRGFIPIGLIIQFLPYIAVVLVLLGGYMYYKHLVNTIARQDIEIVQLTTQLKENESKLSDCHLANEKYQQAIADINKTVEKLITVSEQQQKTMQILKGQITKERVEKTKLVTELTDLKQRPLAQSCEAAIQELTDGIKDITPLAPEQGAK